MSDKRKQDALNLIKEAEGHVKTSLFKWKPDNTSAASCYEKASNIFRGLQMFYEAGENFCRAGECYQRERLPLPAARDFENASDNYLRAEKWKDMVSAADTASELYAETNQSERVPQCLIKKANGLQHINGVEAVKTYKKAIDQFVEIKKTMFIGQSIQNAISFGVKAKLYNETIDFLDSAIIAHMSMKQEHEVNRDRLSQILIYFINNKLQDASNLLDDKLECFIGSDEHIFAARFMDAYEGGDVETFEKLKNDSSFRFCNQEIVFKVKDINIPKDIVEAAEKAKKESLPSGPIQFNEEFMTQKEVTKTDTISTTHISQEQMKAFESLTSGLPVAMGQCANTVNSQEIPEMNEEDMSALL
ncbi:hypothetical protein ENUP19_0054G0038 [Entamoeba nuttalli]|uniref:Gamma-soluble NSF attachment protein n=2 Tax=Entamoeba nuttalli TaxID=412467 RepID=K2HDR0_ENTNP|nr:soluble NSF attachment protein gamma isoform, putative [Entamoeba nuttalli P19]EKE40939.1 soluble NSF attachment protein gamma isoform, putative [Entamoeba nuttalli P19]|eukprot:XP_008856722.1 soluble NSF attachment protein gamma isoform, putative [Entamoeba nuttalli P19]